MRVIFANRYFHPDQSATSRMISSLAFALQRRGFEVAVLASRDIHNRKDRLLPATETINGVAVHRLGTTRFGRQRLAGRAIDYLSFHLLALIWLLRNAGRGDVLVACTDPPFLSVTSAIALRIKGGVMVNWIMDLFPETAVELGMLGRLKRLGLWLRGMRNWSLATRGVVVCPTRTMADYLARDQVAAEQLAVLHHWSDGDEIRPVAAADNPLRDEWGLQDSFVVGYSGNFGRAHDFSTILEAARRLKPYRDIRFLLIGGGQQHAAVLGAVRRFDLDNVTFKPLQPASMLSESLGVADVHLVSLLPELEHCIVPSKFYGILAAGRPTIFIGDTMGEVATTAARNSCGVSLPIGAVDRLVDEILDLRDDPARCAAMGKAARQLLERDYSRDAAVDAWCALLGRLRSETVPQAAGTVPDVAR